MILDFSSIDYHGATRAERISKCRAMAEEAQMLASGQSETRESFRLVASRWRELADQIERGHGDGIYPP